MLDLGAVRPGAVAPTRGERDGRPTERLASCRYFETERLTLSAGESLTGLCDGSTLELWCALSGGLRIRWSGAPATASALEWVLLPAELGAFDVRAEGDSTLLRVSTPEA